MTHVTLVDSSLRDGMHSVRHAFTPEHVRAVAAGLDAAGIDVIEVSHGDGVGGSSIQYGRSAHHDRELIAAAAGVVDASAGSRRCCCRGSGRSRTLREARMLGASVARVATHCTEADIAEQHLEWAAANEMLAVGFLMMSHMLEPAPLAEQAALMASYGARRRLRRRLGRRARAGERRRAGQSAARGAPRGGRGRLPRARQPRLRRRQRARRRRGRRDVARRLAARPGRRRRQRAARGARGGAGALRP